MSLNNVITQIIPQSVIYNPKSPKNASNVKDLTSLWCISDYFGNTEKSFKINRNDSTELYTTKDGFNYKCFLVNENNKIIKKLKIDEPIILSLQYLKKFIEDRDLNSYLKSMEPINKIVDSIPRDEQYSHVLAKIYGLDYMYYQIQYDAMLLMGEYDQLWNKLYNSLPSKQDTFNHIYKSHITIDNIINIKSKCRNNFVNSIELYNIHGCSLKRTTKFIKSHYDNFMDITNQELWDFYKNNGCNSIDNYIEKWLSGDKTFWEKYISEYKKLFKHYNPEIISDEYICKNICGYTVESRDLFYYKSGFEYKSINIHPLFERFCSVILQQFMRDFENNLRSKMKLPNIGESWLSETELFVLIKNAFPNTTVLHQGCPIWLKRQKFDIYIPEYNIAIEYQGIQHFKPVDFFGGVEGYKKTVERDNRKKQLCEENNCTLIYVEKGYNQREILHKIEKEIHKAVKQKF